MNRIDFHSIATILLGGLIDADYSQMDFIYMLFGSFANDNVDCCTYPVPAFLPCGRFVL